MKKTNAMRRAKRRRIGFFGVLGSGNLGNDASLDVVISHIRGEDPAAEIGFFVMGPDELTRRYDGPAVPLQWYEAHRDRLSPVPHSLLKVVGRLVDPFRTLLWVRQYDNVVVPGMGVLEATTPVRPWGFPLGLLSLAVASRLCGTSLALLCIGVEGGTNPVVRWMFRTMARLAAYRSYRDQLSLDAMRDLGVDVSEDHVYPDLVLGRHVRMAHRQPDLVAIGVMNFRGRSEDRAHADDVHAMYLSTITEIVRRIRSEGWRVRLLIGDIEDVPVAMRIQSDVLEGGRSPEDAVARKQVEVAVSATPDELLDQLADARIVIATRYHNVLSALALGTPTISIGYARKNAVLMESFGLGKFCQEARLLDVQCTLNQFHEVVDHYDALALTVSQHLPKMRAEVQRQLEAFSSALTANPPPRLRVSAS